MATRTPKRKLVFAGLLLVILGLLTRSWLSETTSQEKTENKQPADYGEDRTSSQRVSRNARGPNEWVAGIVVD